MPKLTKEQRDENKDRVRRGEVALAAYLTNPGVDPDPVCCLSDLISDLLHCARSRRMDVENMVYSAQNNYEAERDGEG